MEASNRQLIDLVSIGPAMLRSLHALGINNVEQLARQNPRRMYRELCRLKGPQDICCLDVFVAAVAQARNPDLPVEQRQWWYWSRTRKRRNAKRKGNRHNTRFGGFEFAGRASDARL